MYDVIIIGARCAGSPTAMLLARKGHRVLLVERATFPSDTISTHYVQRPGLLKLKSWGLLDRLKATGCPPIRKLVADFGAVTLKGNAAPADEVAEGCAPRRKVLDQLLVNAAVEAGAELRAGFSVQEIIRDGDRVVGLRGRDKGGALLTERARLVIGADGKRSLLARAVEAPIYRAKPSLTCFYYTYWSGVPLAGFEAYRRNRRAILALPTHDGLSGIAVCWPRQEFPVFRADIEGNYLQTLALAPGLAERVRAGRREERFLGTADLPNFFRKPYGPGWALVGDAGYNKDPITGLGISDAFRDAELLATAIDDGLAERRPLNEALGEYERQRNEAASDSYEQTCKLAALNPTPPKALELLAAINENQADVNTYFSIGGAVKASEFYSAANLQRILGPERFARLFTKPKTTPPVLPQGQAAVVAQV